MLVSAVRSLDIEDMRFLVLVDKYFINQVISFWPSYMSNLVSCIASPETKCEPT